MEMTEMSSRINGDADIDESEDLLELTLDDLSYVGGASETKPIEHY